MEVLLGVLGVALAGLIGGLMGWGLVIGVVYLGSWISYLLGK